MLSMCRISESERVLSHTTDSTRQAVGGPIMSDQSIPAQSLDQPQAKPYLPLPFQEGVEFRTLDWLPGYCIGSDSSFWSQMLLKASHKRKWKKLKLKICRTTGYLVANVQIDKKGRKFRMHNLMLEAFVGPRPSGHLGLHRDGNRLNCSLENLYWGTFSDNIRDSIRHGTHFTPFRTGPNIESHLVENIRERHQFGCSLRKIARDTNVGIGIVTAVVRRRSPYND